MTGFKLFAGKRSTPHSDRYCKKNYFLKDGKRNVKNTKNRPLRCVATKETIPEKFVYELILLALFLRVNATDFHINLKLKQLLFSFFILNMLVYFIVWLKFNFSLRTFKIYAIMFEFYVVVYMSSMIFL